MRNSKTTWVDVAHVSASGWFIYVCRVGGWRGTREGGARRGWVAVTFGQPQETLTQKKSKVGSWSSGVQWRGWEEGRDCPPLCHTGPSAAWAGRLCAPASLVPPAPCATPPAALAGRPLPSPVADAGPTTRCKHGDSSRWEDISSDQQSNKITWF